MNPRFLVATLALALAAPFALAHPDGIGPKAYCESYSELAVHDYVAASFHDHSVRVDDIELHPGLEAKRIPLYDGGFSTSCGLLGDWHWEFGMGGARLSSQNHASSCPTTADDYLLMEETPHHPYGWWYPVQVYDALISGGVGFVVAADLENTGADPCGDGLLDTFVECVDSCIPMFDPGLDHKYHVFVDGTYGHIVSSW